MLPRVLFGFILACAVTACAKKAEPECVGSPPTCYPPGAAGACIDKPIPAECGPREARVGTHRRWMCDGDGVRASACTQITAATPPAPVVPLASAVAHATSDAGSPPTCRGEAPRCFRLDGYGGCGDVSSGTATCKNGHWVCRLGNPSSDCKYVGRAGFAEYVRSGRH
jgi:hypothetical protein